MPTKLTIHILVAAEHERNAISARTKQVARRGINAGLVTSGGQKPATEIGESGDWALFGLDNSTVRAECSSALVSCTLVSIALGRAGRAVLSTSVLRLRKIEVSYATPDRACLQFLIRLPYQMLPSVTRSARKEDRV